MSRFVPGTRLRRGLAALAAGVVLAGVAAAPARAEPVSLTGTVTDAAGNPITDACVTAFVYQTGVEAAQGCTDASGTYALTVPASGPYKVRATADTYPELWAYNKPSMETAGGVLLSPDYTAELINFRLFRQTATVTGRITDSTGAPVESVDVRVVPEDSWDVYSAPYDYSDADGRYTIAGVIPGRYRVLFMDNVRGQLYAYGSENRDGATIFELGDGAAITVDDSFLPPGTVEVTVVDAATGAPVTHACVGATFGREQVCDAADGVYRVTDLQPGNQAFSVYTGTHLPVSFDLDVVRGQTVRTTVALTRAEAIVTRVVDRRTNQPVANICAIVAEVGGHGLSANQTRHCTGPDGRLVVQLHGRPGTYRLFILPFAEGYGRQWVGLFGGTGNQELALPVTVAAGANVTIPPVRMDPAGSITGIARASDGTPARGVCALPYAPEARGLWRETPACTDAQGRYTIGGLGPYHWPVLFMGSAWIWSGDQPNRYAAAKVRVTAGQAATMDAVVPAGATISGQVRNAAGNAVNADVRAFNLVTGDYAGPPAGAFFGRPYVLRGLAAQHVRIEYSVSSSAGSTVCWYDATSDPWRARPVRVTPGATMTLDLTMCA